MTLSRGDKVKKLNPTTGEPLTTEEESYIEYEVFDLGNHLSLSRPVAPGTETGPEGPEPETFIVAMLRKVR